MLFARKDEKNQKLAAMSMKIFDVILLSQVWVPLAPYGPQDEPQIGRDPDFSNLYPKKSLKISEKRDGCVIFPCKIIREVSK